MTTSSLSYEWTNRNGLRLELRAFAPEDFIFVTDSWCKSFLGQSRNHPKGWGPLSYMNRDTYFTKQATLIGRLLRAGATLVVVCPVETPDQVLGWVCCEPAARVLHFIYVGGLYRREGLGAFMMRSMFNDLGDDPITVTHWTRCVPFYLKKWGLRYDPYALSEI